MVGEGLLVGAGDLAHLQNVENPLRMLLWGEIENKGMSRVIMFTILSL